MSKDKIFDEPMRQLILTMSAWRRLKARAANLEAENRLIGPIMLHYMAEAWHEAEAEMKDSEKDLMKKTREAMKK